MLPPETLSSFIQRPQAALSQFIMVHTIGTVYTLFSTIIDQTRAFDPLCFGQQMARIKYLLRLHLKDTLLGLAITCALSIKLVITNQRSKSKGMVS